MNTTWSSYPRGSELQEVVMEPELPFPLPDPRELAGEMECCDQCADHRRRVPTGITPLGYAITHVREHR
jgi:hypothetical protein